MKTLLMTVSFLFAAMTGTKCASSDAGIKVSETRKVEAFSSIEVSTVANIYFTQSDTYSLKIEGKEKFVKQTKISVRNSVLSIDCEQNKDAKTNRNNTKKVDVYITAPDLQKVNFSGVGSFNCNTPLKLNDVKFEVEGVGNVKVANLKCKTLSIDLEGVGNADIHVNCDRLKASVDGVGHIVLSGTAGTANISKDGVGSVNTSKLKIGK